MTWFKVDDSFHSHSKVRKVASRAPAALALWVLAGSWSSAHLSDGYVSDSDLPWILPGSEELAAELVAARLWKRVRGGYQFHDWEQCNPSAEQVLALRVTRAAAGAKGGNSRARKASKSQASAEALATPRLEPPSRPDPFLPKRRKEGVGARISAPCGDCDDHRQMEVDGIVIRCPACHPLREESA